MDQKWIAIIIAIALFFYWRKNKTSSTSTTAELPGGSNTFSPGGAAYVNPTGSDISSQENQNPILNMTPSNDLGLNIDPIAIVKDLASRWNIASDHIWYQLATAPSYITAVHINGVVGGDTSIELQYSDTSAVQGLSSISKKTTGSHTEEKQLIPFMGEVEDAESRANALGVLSTWSKPNWPIEVY